MFVVLCILDSIIIGTFVFYLIAALFGDKPFVRLLKLLLGIIAGIGYFCLCAAIDQGELGYKISTVTACLVFFGPVAIVAILWVIGYMFNNE